MLYKHDSGFHAVDVDGCPRLLARLPDPAHLKALPSWEQAGNPVVPKGDWAELSRVDSLPALIDQKSHGSCVGFGSAGAMMSAIALAGMRPVVLSGAYTYSWINGGQDNGASIGDSVDSLVQHGTCLESTVPWNVIYRRQIPAAADQEAQRFRLFKSYRINTFEEAVSAILMEFVVVHAVMVGNTFMNLDADGCAGYDRGPGNHCVHSDGVKKTASGEFVLIDKNSWGSTFGYNGRMNIRQRLFDGLGGGNQDAYAIQAVNSDPQDPGPPPPPPPPP